MEAAEDQDDVPIVSGGIGGLAKMFTFMMKDMKEMKANGGD